MMNILSFNLLSNPGFRQVGPCLSWVVGSGNSFFDCNSDFLFGNNNSFLSMNYRVSFPDEEVFTIKDMNGRVMMEKSEKTNIDVSKWPSGVYVIYNEVSKQHAKFIKI